MPKIGKKTRLTGGMLAVAIATVGAWEGLRTVAYRDPIGIPTVCYGETRGVKMGDRYTVEECKIMLGDGLREFEAQVRGCMSAPDDVPDGAYVAILSWSWNVGTGAACRSTLMRKLNAGDVRGACNELPKWNRAGGRVWKGLTNRREAERKLCLEGL